MRFASVLVLSVLIFSSAVAQSSPVITLENAQQLTPLSSVNAPIPGALAWSADGRWLAAAASSGLNIIDTADGDRVVHVLPDVITEASFGADGLTFIAGSRLYDTESADILLENVGGWADDEHRILFVRETGDVTSLYPVTDREIGEQIISVPFAADRVLVPSVSPLVNGIFIRDIDQESVERSLRGEITLWYWGHSPQLGKRTQQTAQPNSAEQLFSGTFGWGGGLTVSFSPDGRIVSIKEFILNVTLDAYSGYELSCRCQERLVFVETETASAQAVTRVVVEGIIPSESGIRPSHQILDVQRGWAIDDWFLPAMPIPNNAGRWPTWDFTESARFVAIAAERGVEVWRLDTPEPQQIAQLEGETVYAISEDGSRVLTGTGDVLMVWSLDDLAAPAAVTLTIPQSVYAATFDRENAGALLLMNHQGSGHQVWIEQSDGAWEAGSQSMEQADYLFSAGGRFVIRTTRYPLVTTVLDSETGQLLVGSSEGFAASPGNQALAVWDRNVLRIIDTADLQSRDVLTLPGVNGEFHTVNLPLDQAYIRDTANAEFDVYAIQTGEYQFSIPLGESSTYHIRTSFSDDGTRVVIAPTGYAPTVWNVSGSSAVLLLELPDNRPADRTRLRGDGTLVTTMRYLSEDERQALPDPTEFYEIVEVWDIESGALTHSIQTLLYSSAIFVPDTDLLIIQTDSNAELWNLAEQPAVVQARLDLNVSNSYIGVVLTSADFNAARTLALVDIYLPGWDGANLRVAMLIPLDVQSQDVVSVDPIYVGSSNSIGPRNLYNTRFSANETYALMTANYLRRALQSVVYRIDDESFVDLPSQASMMTIDETAVVTANPLRVWSVAELFSEEDPQPLAEYPVTGVESMAFSADGMLLYAWGQDGVTVWHIDG